MTNTVSQVVTETISGADDPSARVAQVVVETLALQQPPPAKTAQVVTEVQTAKQGLTVTVPQIVIEVIYQPGTEEPPPPEPEPEQGPCPCPFQPCMIHNKHYYFMDLVKEMSYHHFAKPVRNTHFNDVNDFAPARLKP